MTARLSHLNFERIDRVVWILCNFEFFRFHEKLVTLPSTQYFSLNIHFLIKISGGFAISVIFCFCFSRNRKIVERRNVNASTKRSRVPGCRGMVVKFVVALGSPFFLGFAPLRRACATRSGRTKGTGDIRPDYIAKRERDTGEETLYPENPPRTKKRGCGSMQREKESKAVSASRGLLHHRTKTF